MAIALTLGPTPGYTAGTPATASFTSAPTSGNLMIALGRGSNSHTNGSILGWTKAVGSLKFSGEGMGLWYKVAGAGESSDVSLAWAGSTTTWLVIEEWGGFTGTPTLDQTASVADPDAAVTSRSSGTTAATTIAAEVCFAGISMGNTVSAESWSNSFATEWRDSATPLMLLGSRVVSSTAAYETTLSWTTSRRAWGLIATFGGVSATTWTPKVIIIS